MSVPSPSPASHRRLVENEEHHKRLNEKMQTLVLDFEEGEEQEELRYFCECSDPHCRDRIAIDVDRYESAHRQRDRFTIVPGHEALAVEEVVEQTPTFLVVDKLIDADGTPSPG